MTTKEQIRVTICGGGNGAHTTAGIASSNEDFEVTVLDIYEDEPERWTNAMAKNGFTVNFSNGQKIIQLPGKIKFNVTRDVMEAVPKANIVVIVSPAYTHETYLKLIVPHLANDAIVVGMPGQPGFEYQCLYYLKKQAKACVVMATETLPWAARINKYGSDVSVLGTKDEVTVSLIKQGKTSSVNPISTLQKILGKAPVLKPASNPIQVCLLAKAILHPPIMYARWKNWDGKELDSPPPFYQGVDKTAERYLDIACKEMIDVAEKIKQRFPELTGIDLGTAKDWLVEHYGDQISNKSTLLTALQTNKAYDGLVHPMKKTASGKFVPNFGYRYTTEDIPYGIVVQRAIAEMVGVKTPILDELITWGQSILGEKFLVDGKINTKCTENTRIPQMYGLKSLEDIMKFCESY